MGESRTALVTGSAGFIGYFTCRRLLADGLRVIGVDSLTFISYDGIYRAVGESRRDHENPQYCDACFTGEYPIPLTDRDGGPIPLQLSLLAERN